jgi:hypothetical protein
MTRSMGIGGASGLSSVVYSLAVIAKCLRCDGLLADFFRPLFVFLIFVQSSLCARFFSFFPSPFLFFVRQAPYGGPVSLS